MIMGLVTSQLWKGGAIAGAVASIALGGMLGVTVLQKNAAVKRADKLHAEIHAPVDGYIARLALCKGNVKRLDAGLARQNAALTALQADSADRLAAAGRNLATAQQTAAEYRVQASRLARATPVGVTQCDRILDVDAMVKEAFR